MSDEKNLNEDTHHPDILAQAGINLPQEFDANATDGDVDGFVQDGSRWERPVESKVDSPIASAVSAPAPTPVAVEPVTLPVVMAAPVVEAAPAPAVVVTAAALKRNKGKKSTAGAAIPTELEGGTVVLLSKLVFESRGEMNSNSVRAVQVRLMELGYITAGDDKPGWISAGTVEALEDYKKDNAIEADSVYGEDLIKSLFVGTSVQVLP